MDDKNRSAQLFARGKRHIPDGVSSPLRSFRLVGGDPVVAREACGARIHDVDDREYLDFLNGFGALILGHAHPEVVEAIRAQAGRGTSYGLANEAEYQLAERIVDSTPSLEAIRFVCSGTEAVMTATRIARSHTGRSLILKFRGSYHGHSDALLASPLNLEGGAAALKTVSRGITRQANREVVLSEYNDVEEASRVFADHGDDIAAVVVEPHSTNMGFVKSRPEFIQALRDLTHQYGALLIFDEVVSGFRFNYGGISSQFGIDPDLTTFGKIIGGGTPVGAYGGKSLYLSHVAIGGGVFQSGTFAGNPLTTAAGNATLEILSRPGFYERLDALGADLQQRLEAGFAAHGIPYLVSRAGSVLGIAFRDAAVPMRNYRDVKTQDYDTFTRFHQRLRLEGFLLAPSLEEPIFLSAAHTPTDLARFADAAVHALRELHAELNN
ncbi:aspartate aminotransferase family protein [Burkholderia plantarii]|uniref:Glutamate-1-semialdehyde 2,1-aminomutase n=1 Tax=Burkholderia plantarii TaxID=41899 RepID=A0A0B6S9A2_BURPL|nr:glutamate-1-semialdehyde 2,1-aminomutase [Burkholderia plantarii]AJK49835.1 glutamate-1-semialdehyde 2,1-aminomutase HemL [Burkholderia plantarii]